MMIDAALRRLWVSFSGHTVCGDGCVRTYLTPFRLFWLTFLVNSPHNPPFKLYRWGEHFEYGVD